MVCVARGVCGAWCVSCAACVVCGVCRVPGLCRVCKCVPCAVRAVRAVCGVCGAWRVRGVCRVCAVCAVCRECVQRAESGMFARRVARLASSTFPLCPAFQPPSLLRCSSRWSEASASRQLACVQLDAGLSNEVPLW